MNITELINSLKVGDDWRLWAKKAWSFRFAIAGTAASAVSAILPFLGFASPSVQIGMAVLAAILTSLAGYSTLVPQKDL